MNTLKSSLLVAIAVGMILCGFSQIGKIDIRAFDEDSILYITANTYSYADENADIILANSFKSIDNAQYNYIIIDKAMMSDTVRTDLQEAFLNRMRIIIAGDITKNEVREYFGLEKKTYTEENVKSEEDALQADNMVDVSKFASAGKLIYHDASGTNITEIKVEDSNSERLLVTFKYCFKYDYLKLGTSSDSFETDSYSYSWSNVDIDTATYDTARCTINTAAKIDRNDGNPNSDDEYLSHVGYAVDTDMISGYYLAKTDVEVKGRSISLVYAYGPANMTNPANKTISFSLPYSLGISFTPGPSRVNIQKIAGGIDSNNFKTRFNAVNFLGLDSTTTSMLAQADIESYQQSNGYFYGFGQYHILTYLYGWNNPLTYYNSAWDMASPFSARDIS